MANRRWSPSSLTCGPFRLPDGGQGPRPQTAGSDCPSAGSRVLRGSAARFAQAVPARRRPFDHRSVSRGTRHLANPRTQDRERRPAYGRRVPGTSVRRPPNSRLQRTALRAAAEPPRRWAARTEAGSGAKWRAEVVSSTCSRRGVLRSVAALAAATVAGSWAGPRRATANKVEVANSEIQELVQALDAERQAWVDGRFGEDRRRGFNRSSQRFLRI